MPRDLPISAEELEKVVEKYGTPLQLYDESAIRNNIKDLLTSFSQAFPGFKQFFAVKALPNPAILKLVVDSGCGLDCSSTSELYIAQKLGIPGESVIYTSNYTSEKDLGIAFDQGVIINLDDVSLVDTLVKARGRCPELMSFRLNPGIGRTDSTTKSNVLGGPNAKFGVPPEQILAAYQKAIKHGAKRFGIHMMTGSCVLNDDYWMEAVSILLKTVDKLNSTLGIEFEFMNIGGGLGIPYKPEQSPVDVKALVSKLQAKFDSDLPKGLRANPPKLCMENGRYITGPFGWLVSRCQAKKQAWGQTYYGLDACMANLMRPGMYESYHHISVPTASTLPGHEEEAANVVGTLCENNDWFAKKRMLPKADVGDLFVIHDTGAHSHSMGFQYNGKLRAPEVLIRSDGRYSLIRERETIESLYSNTTIPSDL